MTAFGARHLNVLRGLVGDPDAEIVEAEFLGQGWTNENFRVRIGRNDWALRICDPTAAEDPEKRRRELALLAGPARALAPALRGVQLPEGHLLTEFVPGRLLADAPPTPEELGRFAATMHEQLGRLGWSFDPVARIEGHLARARRAGKTPARVVLDALEGLVLEPAARAGCHNDFNPWNVIIGPDRWFVVDWETAGDNHPLYDLVCMFEGLGWADRERARALESYGMRADGSPPPPDQLRAVTLLFQLGEYAWAFAERARGNDRDELTAQIETSLERIRALR